MTYSGLQVCAISLLEYVQAYTPPRNFHEFYSDHPEWVMWLCVRLLGRTYPDDDVRELEHDLILFLMSVPEGKYSGICSDRIQMFDPSKYGEAVTPGIFFNWLKIILTNQFRTRYSRYGQDAMGGELLEITVRDHEVEVPAGKVTEEMIADYLPTRTCQDKRLFIQGYREYVERKAPELVSIVDKIAEGHTCDEYKRVVHKLKRLADQYQQVYRRRKANPMKRGRPRKVPVPQ